MKNGTKTVKVARLPGAQATRRDVRLPFRVKENPSEGTCAFWRCGRKTRSERSKWCQKHCHVVRGAQLREARKRHLRRRAQGRVGHHVVYDGKPTKWTLENPDAAVQLIKFGRSIVRPEVFESALTVAAMQ